MIWDTSIWRLGCSNRSKIRSAQKCYLCLRYVVSPMSPGRTSKRLVGANGFEPSTSWSRTRHLNPINALFGVAYGTRSVIPPLSLVPNLYLDVWGEPLRWHKLFGHSFCFHRRILASPSRRRGLGKGTAFESLSPEVLSKSSRCSLCSQKTPSLRFEIRPDLTPRSVARTLREVDSPAPSASAADCNTAR